MRSYPWRTNANSFTVPLEELDQGGVAQWLASAETASAYEKDERRFHVARALVHDVPAECLERAWLVQVNNSLGTGLGAGALRMVGPVPHDDAPSPVLHILQVQAEGFSGS